jgi:hypothetical protein
MKITKEQFTKSMEAIKEQVDIDIKNHDALEVLLPSDFVTNFRNVLYNALIDILEEVTNDNGGWIEYFLWELDFGKENWRLKVYSKDKKEIPLSSIDDLWNLLNEND